MLLVLDNDVHPNPGPREHQFSVFYLNIRSFRYKISYIEDIASESSVICITESHLDNNVSNSDVVIDGFSCDIFRKDRSCFGGGVLVYTSQDICVKRCHDLEFSSGELIWLEIRIPNYKVLICTVYRPPGSGPDFWNHFEYSIEQALNFTGNVVITGDLNVELFVENKHRLNEIIRLYDMSNVIKEPTRMGALLYPVLISNNNIFIDAEVIEVVRAVSDHDATLIHLKIPCMNNKKKNVTRNVWSYKNADFILNSSIDVDDMSERFTHKYLEMMRKHMPSRTVLVRPNDKHWFNSEIRKEIRIRNRLHSAWRNNKCNYARNKYKSQRNKVNNMIKYTREPFSLSANEVVDSITKTDSKAYWSLIKKLTKGSNTNYSIPLLIIT